MKYSVKLVLRTTKTLSNQKHPIYLRIIIDRKVKDYSLGSTYSSAVKDWSIIKECFKDTYPGFDDTNKHLESVKNKARKILHYLEEQETIYTITDFDRLFNKEEETVMSLEYMDTIVLILNAKNEIGNANVYRDTKRSIETYLKFQNQMNGKSIDYSLITDEFLVSLRKQPRIDIPLQNIDYKFLKEYESFLNVHCGPRTIHLRMRTLRAVFNKAIKEENFSLYPFKEYSFKHLSTKTRKRALKASELKLLFDCRLDKDSRKYDSLNYFKFMYLSRGMNFTDLAYLKKLNIMDGRFSYIRAKTHKEIKNVHIFDLTQSIIDEYETSTLDSDYVFPILYPTHNSSRKQKDRINSVLKKVNKDLNEIAVELGIQKGVTSYVARHSFATILKFMGESTALIAEQLGHGERNTQVYLDEFDENTLKESTEKALTAIL